MNGTPSTDDANQPSESAQDSESGGDERALPWPMMAWMSAILLWTTQPPWGWWPVALIALIPWIAISTASKGTSRRDWLVLWCAGFVYWALTLQGLRHAHPAMHLGWLGLSAFFGLYPVAFVALNRRLFQRGVPILIAAPIVWVGGECLRNYLLSGISAAMLGHTMVDVPELIQIADLFGSYGISFVLVVVNVAVYEVLCAIRQTISWQRVSFSVATATSMLLASLLYGQHRLQENGGGSLATFALIQRSEPMVFAQDIKREVEIFERYFAESIEAFKNSDRAIDAVVWPESMYSGGATLMLAAANANLPSELELTDQEFRETIQQRKNLLLDRSIFVQSTLAAAGPLANHRPDLLVGCGVVNFLDRPHLHSGLIHIRPDGTLADWYAKTHLVLFGEYYPIITWIPGLRSLIPADAGLTPGEQPKQMLVDNTKVLPSICIETAVERVTINQIAKLRSQGQSIDVVVNATNDGWFDQSSVVEHHLRCSQLVAVGCRRPIVLAANNGPTAWIDSSGRIQESLPIGTAGSIIATPQRDSRTSLYTVIGDWPAKGLGLMFVLVLADLCRSAWQKRRRASAA